MDTVRIESQGPVTTVRLHRPDARNAFNEVLIAELTQAFGSIPASARVVVLAGEGNAFCAGADVSWMKKSKDYTEEENARDAAAMAAMLRAIDECPKPVLARVNGPALGGGSGLVAACDIAIAAETSMFGFTEVRLGIMPAVISTFVLPKVGLRAARRYFLTGERFGAREALAMGLVHEVVAPDALDAKVQAITGELLQCGPRAVESAKKLLREVAGQTRDQAIDHTVRAIARLRVTPEAQEGLGAFLEKRKPNWS
jgi:methylglutaconyl-CoA hydratase